MNLPKKSCHNRDIKPKKKKNHKNEAPRTTKTNSAHARAQQPKKSVKNEIIKTHAVLDRVVGY